MSPTKSSIPMSMLVLSVLAGFFSVRQIAAQPDVSTPNESQQDTESIAENSSAAPSAGSEADRGTVPSDTSLAEAVDSDPDATPIQRINRINALLQQGDAQTAIKLYESLSNSGYENPALSYNQGVAHYRADDTTTARKYFTEAFNASDEGVAAKAAFNLGNCDYRDATTLAQQEPEQAISKLKSAIGHYRNGLRLNPRDNEARKNIQLAAQWMDELERQQQENEQQQESEDEQEEPNQEDQQEPQEQEDPENDDQEDSEQNDSEQENPEQDEQESESQQDSSNSDQQQNDQEQSGQNQTDPNDPSSDSENEPPQPTQESSQRDDDRSDDPPSRGNEDQAPESQDSESESSSDPSEQQPESDPAQNSPGEPSPEEGDAESEEQSPAGKEGEDEKEPIASGSTGQTGTAGQSAGKVDRQEILKMLQAIRDRDLSRRNNKLRRMQSQHIPVDRDW